MIRVCIVFEGHGSMCWHQWLQVLDIVHDKTDTTLAKEQMSLVKIRTDTSHPIYYMLFLYSQSRDML